jgi:hypothetical protein
MRPLEPVHFSNLKAMALSPAHYQARLNAPAAQTPAMRFGQLVHAVILGGAFEVWPGDRRGKAWELFKDAHPDALIVTCDEYDKARLMSDAVRVHPIASTLIVGHCEKEMSFTLNGRACAGRLDVVNGDGCFWTELKSANCTEPYRFQRAALRMSYHAQMAWYQDMAIANGIPARTGYIVAVETAPPFAVTVLRLTPRALEEGRKLCRLWLERLIGCEQCHEWPSYTQSIVDFDVAEDVDLIIDGEEIAA